MQSDRSDSRFAIDCCLDYFGLPATVYDVVQGDKGRDLMARLWSEQGERMYQSPLYLLRQEWFHMEHPREIGGFFNSLSDKSILLDFGCGTAEAERTYWIDRGGRTILEDLDGTLQGYLRYKYPMETVAIMPTEAHWNALLCLDVLEHLREPMQTWRHLWSLLPVGGSFLAWFDPGAPHPGHLPRSITQRDAWLEHVTSHATILGNPACAIWGIKLT